MKENENQAEEAIESQIERIKEFTEFLSDDETKITDLPPEGTRYIMTVTKHYPNIAAAYIKNATNQNVLNSITILLLGQPSPSSPRGFTKAYLTFVDAGQPLRRPQVAQNGNELILYIFYPLSYAATAEKILREARVSYCWIGNFSDSAQNYTNIYADIHAEY